MAYVAEMHAIELMKIHGHEFQLDGLGAGSNDIFREVYLKRRRTPDLVCPRCGQKLEVRSKSQLCIRMSHSQTRPFDRELESRDWVGFMRVTRKSYQHDPSDPASYRPSDVLYVIRVSELSAKQHLTVMPPPKTQSKGLEKALTWPTLLSPVTGTLLGRRSNPGRIFILTDDGNQVELEAPPNSYVYNELKVGDRVTADETLLCGVARTLKQSDLRCHGYTE